MSNNNRKDPDRLKVIAGLLSQNLSQAEVGRRLGLSRARIGEIVMAHGLSKCVERAKPLLSKRQSKILAFIRDFEADNPSAHCSRSRGGLRSQQHSGCHLQSVKSG